MSLERAVIVVLMVMFGHQYNTFIQAKEETAAFSAEKRSVNGKKTSGKNITVSVYWPENLLHKYKQTDIAERDNVAVVVQLKTKRPVCFANSSEEECQLIPSKEKFPRSSAFKYGAENIFKVRVVGDAKYVSPFAIESSFPRIKLFRLEKSKHIEMLTIPRSSKTNLAIELAENQRLAYIVDNATREKPISSFYYDDHNSFSHSLTVSLSELSSPGDFTVMTTAGSVDVKIPHVIGNGTLRNVQFSYRGRQPDCVKLNYSEAIRGIQSLTIFINDIPKSVRSFLPPISVLDKVPLININFKHIPVHRFNLIDEISAEHKRQVESSDKKYLEGMSTPNPPETTMPNGDITQQYVCANLRTIIKNSRKDKNNTVNTYCLVIDEEFPETISLAKSITINFCKMIYINSRQIYSFGLVKFNQIDNLLIQKWNPITLGQFYDSIIEILTHVQSATFPFSFTLKKVIGELTQQFFHEIKLFTQKHGMIHGLNAANRPYMEIVLIRGNDLIVFANNQNENMKRLPRLSQKLYSKKTLLYQDIVKLLIDTKQIQGLQKGQQGLMDAAKIKSETQISIAEEEGKILEAKRKQSLQMLKKMQSKRQILEREVEQGTAVFKAAVKRRQRQAELDAALSVFSAITGIFSGGISGIEKVGDLFKAAEKFKDMMKTIRKIANMIKRITALIETLGGLAGNVMDIYNKINVAQEGFDPGFELREQTEINWDKYDNQTKDYSDQKLNKILEQSSKVDAFEVLEWDLAKAQVDGMMDASLSAEIPETLSYKKAILQLIAAGRAHTEAAIEFAQLKVDIYMNEYRKKAYSKEVSAINTAKDKINTGYDKQEFHRNLHTAEKQLKVELFLHINDYCEAQFYYTLSSCFIFSEFSFKYSLEHTQYILSKMLIDSLNKINDLYPQPQTFKRMALEYKEKPECGAYMSSLRRVLKSAECQELGSESCGKAADKFLLSKVPKNASERCVKNTQIDKIQLYMDCLASPVFQLKEKKTTTISITMDEKAFKDLDRIRIDDIKVRLNGATTSSGYVTVLISNGGIYEDRLRGNRFVFSADMWRRMYRYKEGSPADGSELLADVYKEFDYLFNKPTPFSTWDISLPDYEEENLNLKNVTSISLIFSGTFMMSSNLNEKLIAFKESLK